MSTVYLLHFDEPYPAGRRPQHYVGVARELDKRVAEHRNGNPGKGGSLTRALKDKGIGFTVVEEWHFATADEAFAFEKKLKRRRKHKRHCRICRAKMVAEIDRELHELGRNFKL
jgi:predicted GIY-YIG superfamily endonuclease